MSKRTPATASKHARRPKIAAKPQRAAQTIVRSPKIRRSVAASSTESSPKPHNESKPTAPLAIENPVTALQENPVTAPQEDVSHTMTDNSLSKGFDLSTATANVRVYQELLEISQANMTFAFEFSQRVATIRSPIEFFIVIAEFTSKRIAMFGKYSTEMAELSTKWRA
ncbi:Phasin protein [Bradyrhizobium sp. AUGA SZCCT0283]|uniref:Phasin protein n=1 Tax=Bradyrhizobium sp. AUGA SZCCT0283 TaxID=2807671 RepID=UPI001BA6F209|nr:Phasin protein [Bradyrhizobium sp. AUGA SZCCT0283]MBR1279012.1 Phasin protein [Bradyrhizobium sp. AUGA SZCCT0283]